MFKVGDHIILKAKSLKPNSCFSAVVLEINGNRVQIIFKENYTIQGDNVVRWFSIDEIEIDKKYYRDEKINTILSNSNPYY